MGKKKKKKNKDLSPFKLGTPQILSRIPELQAKFNLPFSKSREGCLAAGCAYGSGEMEGVDFAKHGPCPKGGHSGV